MIENGILFLTYLDIRIIKEYNTYTYKGGA